MDLFRISQTISLLKILLIGLKSISTFFFIYNNLIKNNILQNIDMPAIHMKNFISN